ncbi:MAG: CsbD family protein [Nitriliruptorales bacterium]|nr:CsbD family protein [Nitriliruptorales bacterium]
MDLKQEGVWDQFRGHLKEAWGVLTDDDLDRAEGRWDRIVGLVKEKTGDTTEAIEQRMNELLESIRQPQR